MIELEQYKAFACELMNACTTEGSCDDLDGGDLQALAVEHGLLVVEDRIVPCEENAENCVCTEFVDDGDHVDCFRHKWDKT